MSINTKALIEIAQRNPTSEDFFTYAACRERHVREGVSRLHQIRDQMKLEGFSPVPEDLLVMFKELERAGVGSLKGDMFKWTVSIKEVGAAVVGEAIKTKKLPAKIGVIPKALKHLVVCFDNHKEVSVSFTPNLTQEEITFLAAKLLQESQ